MDKNDKKFINFIRNIFNYDEIKSKKNDIESLENQLLKKKLEKNILLSESNNKENQIKTKEEDNKFLKNQLLDINLEKDKLMKRLKDKENQLKLMEEELYNKENQIKIKEEELIEIKNKLLATNKRVENLKVLLEGQKINYESENLLLIEQLNVSQNQVQRMYKEYLENKIYITESRKQIDKAKILFARVLKKLI